MSEGCEVCCGSGRLDVLDVWGIQRTYIKGGREEADNAVASLPMLKGAIACPKCCPDAPDDMEALLAELGDPWKPATFSDVRKHDA